MLKAMSRVQGFTAFDEFATNTGKKYDIDGNTVGALNALKLFNSYGENETEDGVFLMAFAYFEEENELKIPTGYYTLEMSDKKHLGQLELIAGHALYCTREMNLKSYGWHNILEIAKTCDLVIITVMNIYKTKPCIDERLLKSLDDYDEDTSDWEDDDDYVSESENEEIKEEMEKHDEIVHAIMDKLEEAVEDLETQTTGAEN